MKSNSGKFKAWGILVAILVVVGLGWYSMQRPGDTTGTGAVPNTTAGTGEVVGQDLVLERLDGGGQIVLADYQGEKPVILDFWASWCHNCQRAMPKLNEFYKKYQDDVEVIGVNLQESPSTVQRFVEQNDIVFPIALDPQGLASREFGVRYTNVHVLLNRDGSLSRIVSGDVGEGDVVQLIADNKL